MAYVSGNPKTKKQLKEWIKQSNTDPDQGKIYVFQPGPFGPNVKDGRVAIEGPHYPQPHSWYAEVEVKDGYIVRVIS